MSADSNQSVSVGNEESQDSEQYLTFLLDGQEYAIEILKVQGIQGWTTCTELPNTPEHILGVINLRGSIVPILDLRVRFNQEKIEYNDLTVVIVVKISHGDTDKVVGLVVDAVSEVYNIDKNNLSNAPNFGAGIDIEYINGLASVNDSLVICINADKLVSDSVLKAIDAELAA